MGAEAKGILLPNLKRWCREGVKAPETVSATADRAVALFEISEGSPVPHEKICRKIVKKFEGVIVGLTESGLLCVFPRPVDACLAAINVKQASSLMNLATRVGIAWGAVREQDLKIPFGGRGEAFKRAIRMAAMALPGQVLIDSSLRSAIDAELLTFPDLMTSRSASVEMKGLGKTEVMELTAKQLDFSAPTEEHVPVIGDVEVSPVQLTVYPEETEPGRYLACDTCQKILSPEGNDGILVIEREGDVVKKFHLVHKGDCDTVKTHSWRDLSEFTNPECYVQLIIALMNNWALKRLAIEDASGLVRLLMGMYRKVYRPTTNAEHLNFIGVMQLMHVIGE